jgi:hypothetical protein
VHELSAPARLLFSLVTGGLPPEVIIRVPGLAAWKVPRIFIAVHGLRAADLPDLAPRYGFEPAP